MCVFVARNHSVTHSLAVRGYCRAESRTAAADTRSLLVAYICIPLVLWQSDTPLSSLGNSLKGLRTGTSVANRINFLTCLFMALYGSLLPPTLHAARMPCEFASFADQFQSRRLRDSDAHDGNIERWRKG